MFTKKIIEPTLYVWLGMICYILNFLFIFFQKKKNIAFDLVHASQT
jgi:hypothetical protein